MARKIILLTLGLIFSIAAAIVTVKVALLVKGESMFEVGDYYFEVDPVLISFINNPSLNIYSDLVPPLMTPLSVEIRAIFSLILFNLGIISDNDNPVQFFSDFNQRYLYGSISVMVVGYGALFLAIFKDSLNNIKNIKLKKEFLFYSLATLVLIAINPLSLFALNWSHPEEILLAATIAASGLLILKKDYAWAAVFAGMALATKQPAIFLIPAALLAVPPAARKRFVIILAATFSVLVIPWIIFGFNDFISANLFSAGGQDFNISRGLEVFTGLGLRSIAEVGKPLIALAAILIPLSAARLNQKEKSWKLSQLKITGFQFALMLPLIFLIRSIFDLGNIAYYALPAGMVLIALDFVWQKESKRFEKTPITLPIITTVGSVALSLLFYRNIEINPELRGVLTAIISFSVIGIGLFFIYGKENLLKMTKKSWATVASFLAAAVLVLGISHVALNNPDPILQYKTFKFFPQEKINTALPSNQNAYWLTENLTSEVSLEKQGLHPNIIFTRYSEKGEITSTFVYGNENSGAKISIETYNKIPDKEKAFALNCLRTNECNKYKPFKTKIGPVFFKEEKDQFSSSWASNRWEALLIDDSSEQLIKITNGGLPVSFEEVILKLETF